MINATIFLLALGSVLALLVVGSWLYQHPSRRCPDCGESVRLTSRTCPHCRYQFVWFRFGR